MDFFESLFRSGGFLPHGYCFAWTPALLWSMVGADAVIAAAYFSIPAAILSFVRRRDDLPMRWVAWLFSAFIFACGITHLMDIWTIWRPDYGLQALTKTVTAAISIVTAVALWLLIPKALKVPSPKRMKSVVQALASEVEKRRGAEDRVAEIQQNLAVTLESIGAGFLATDREGRVTRMNAVAEQVLGWPEAQAQGLSVWDVFDREDRPAAYRASNPVDVLIDTGATVDTVRHVVAISRDGRRTSLELKAALTRAEDGSVRGMAMVFRDITSVIRAAAESSRLAAIVESSHDAIIAKGLDGIITSWNAAAQALFGYTAEEAVGQPITMLIPIDREFEEQHIMSEITRGSRVPAFDTERLAKDGTRLRVSVTISPIRDAQQRIVGASKIARDVAPQRRAEQALRDSEVRAQQLEAENRQIQEANRLKSQFLANMSHELRTPLNAIIGFSDLMLADIVAPGSPQQREFLGHISTSGQHLLQLINDVLDLSKVESGKFEFVAEPVDLPLLVKEVTDNLDTAIQRKRLQLSTHLDPSLNDLMLDTARLKQVLYNYLSNAIKFTPEGGRIAVRAMPQGAQHFRVEVEDSGIGVAAKDMPRLFVEFQQLDSGYDKRHQGTGLGLSLTRRLVEAQGGRVGVHSKPGAGSIFHMVLNRVHGTDELAERRSRPRDATATALPRCLVIEDSHDAQARLAPTLSQAGFSVDRASTPDQAVAHASKTSYDAIALELTWQGHHGLGALADIRRQGANRDTPVLGVAMPTDAQAAAAFAIANVLSKPISADEITASMAPFRHRTPQRATVMVIDDDPMALGMMQATLTHMGIAAVCMADGRTALRDIGLYQPDALILDLMMPGFDGFAVLDELRRMPAWMHLPVYIWTSMVLTDDEYASLHASARAVLSKGGGAVAAMLDELRRWRPAAAPALTATVDPEPT